MNLPHQGDYIDIHTHDAKPASRVFIVENLMAHEGKNPDEFPGQACSFGIHPWFLNENNHNQLIDLVKSVSCHPDIIAIGEAGFDKLRGPSPELQRITFEKQIIISEEIKKPVVIHCVRAWDELLSEHKKLKPKMPWLVHGFRGNKDLALQLISKGMYLSFWFEFVLRPESAKLLRNLPGERIFLETDGADVSIISLYKKVAVDLGLAVNELKEIIFSNFKKFFKL